jgi:hypothetical protein
LRQKCTKTRVRACVPEKIFPGRSPRSPRGGGGERKGREERRRGTKGRRRREEGKGERRGRGYGWGGKGLGPPNVWHRSTPLQVTVAHTGIARGAGVHVHPPSCQCGSYCRSGKTARACTNIYCVLNASIQQGKQEKNKKVARCTSHRKSWLRLWCGSVSNSHDPAVMANMAKQISQNVAYIHSLTRSHVQVISRLIYRSVRSWPSL